MQSGLGLTRNRHGNQFHTRICIPKDLALQLGRKEIRISLGTEQRRYAIRAARLIHARKITAFDQLRAVMDKNKTPTPEQQAETRKRLLAVIQQRQQAEAYPDPNKGAESARRAQEAEARYAQEADQQREREKVAALIAQDPDAALALAAIQQETAQGLAHARAVQKATEAELKETRAELQATRAGKAAAIQVAATHINEATAAHQQRQQAQAEHAVTVENMAGKMASMSIALARSGATAAPGKTSDQEKAELPSVRFSEVITAYQESLAPTKREARTNQQYVAERRCCINHP